MLNFLTYYIQVLFCTIGLLILCGFVSEMLRRAFYYLLGGANGFKIIKGVSIIGTPVHEFGHAMMCVVFGHKIHEVKFYSPEPADESGYVQLGYVNHSYNKKNLYQSLGTLFIGLGPIFSGIGVVTLVLYLCFPHAIAGFFSASFSALSSGDSFFSVLWEGIKLPINMFKEDGFFLWKILGVFVIFSVTMHVTLSGADIKNSVRGLLIYLVLAFLFAFVTSLFGKTVVGAIGRALNIFALYCAAVYVVFYVFSLIILLVALAVYFIRKRKR